MKERASPSWSRHLHTPNESTRNLPHTQEHIRTKGVMAKHPYWTKIELCFLLIPDEQVLLFKGPNPLQSTHWNPNPLSPLPLSTVCVFSLFFFPISAFPELWAEKQKHWVLNELWKSAWGKPLKKPKLSPPFPLSILFSNTMVNLHISFNLICSWESSHLHTW